MGKGEDGMKEILTLVVICSINMSFIAGLLFLFSPILSKYYKAGIRYYAWFIIILGMLIPIRPEAKHVFFQVNLSDFDWNYKSEEKKEKTSDITTNEGELLQNDITSKQEKNRESNKNEILEQEINQKQTNQIKDKRSYLTLLDVIKQNGYLACSLFVIWILGIIFVLGKQVKKHMQLIRFLEHWEEEVTTLELLDLLEKIKQKRKIKKHIALFTCEGISTPMLVGLIKPKIILPKERYGHSELAFILEHECVHYKRKDLWYKCFVLLVRAIHWFNPLVSMIWREIDSICEISCDEMVLEEKEKEQKIKYIETILGIASDKKKNQSVFSTTFYGGKQYMKRRIASIINNKKKKVGITFTALVLVSTMGSNLILSAQKNEIKEIPWSYFANMGGTNQFNEVIVEDVLKAGSKNIIAKDVTGKELNVTSTQKPSKKEKEDSIIVEDGMNDITEVVLVSDITLGTKDVIITEKENKVAFMKGVSFVLYDKDKNSYKGSVTYSCFYEIKDREKMTAKEREGILEHYEEAMKEIIEKESYESFTKETILRLQEEINSYLEKNQKNQVSFQAMDDKNNKIVFDTVVLGEKEIYSKKEAYVIPTGTETSLKEQAEQRGYKYIKVDFNEDKATNKKMSQVFQKNNLAWNDKVWVEFEDTSWTIYNPEQELHFSAMCAGASPYAAKVYLSANSLEQLTIEEIEEKAEKSDDIILEILNQKELKKEELQKEIVKAIASKLGIEEKYIIVEIFEL